MFTRNEQAAIHAAVNDVAALKDTVARLEQEVAALRERVERQPPEKRKKDK